MNYQTGTATSSADLLDQLQTFLAAQGWTVVWRFQIAQGTWRWANVSKSGFFWNLYEFLSVFDSFNCPSAFHLKLGFATAYNSGVDANAQTNDLGRFGYVTDVVPPYTAYHFFEGTGASGPYCYIAVEITPGQYRHFGFGVLDKTGAGAWTGGDFFFGTVWTLFSTSGNQPGTIDSYPFDDFGQGELSIFGNGGIHASCYVRGTFPGSTAGWGAVTTASSYGTGAKIRSGAIARVPYNSGGVVGGSPSYSLMRMGPVTGPNVTPLIRAHCFVDRGSQFSSYIGEPPNFRHVDMTLFNPGDEVTLGSETWKVFPIIRKNLTTPSGTAAASGKFGIAYRKA